MKQRSTPGLRFAAGLIALVALLGGMPALWTVPTQATHLIPVSVTITRIVNIDTSDDGIEDHTFRGEADMYVGVEINGNLVHSFNEHGAFEDDDDIEPFYVLSGMVPGEGPAFTVSIEVWDHDDCEEPFCDNTGIGFSDDDKGDVDPGGDDEVNLAVTLDGKWTGDVSWPVNCSQGSGTGAVQVCWDISTDSSSGDSDGDGLLDGWERNGFNADGDNTIDVNLPGFGAKWDHKDLFLELDYSAGQTPSRDDIQVMKRAFAAAPFTNLDGVRGINLFVDTGNLVDPTAREGQVPGTCSDGIDNGGDGQVDAADQNCDNVNAGSSGEYLETSVEDPQPGNCTDGIDNDGDGNADAADLDCLVGDNLSGGNFLTALNNCGLDNAFYTAKATNFNANRRLIFRYAISTVNADVDTDGPGPDTDTCTIGGQGEIGGNDFIDYNHDGGTIMHELGHNLNLRHGGNEDTNCKPNYVSGMDYDEQFGINRVNGGVILDYSPPRINVNGTTRGNAPLGPLVESALSENVVLDASDNANLIVFKDLAGNRRTGPLTGGIDWSGDSADPPFEPNVQANINTSSPPPPATNGRPGACRANTSNTDTLTGFHDWNQISIPFRQFGDSADSAINPELDPVPTIAERDEMIAQINTADVSVSIADSPDPVGAGERLALTLTATNHGPNPAHSVEVKTTLPAGVVFVDTSVPCVQAGSLVTCNLGSLDDDESRSFTIRVDIPADFVYPAGPKTITTTATVDNLYGPDPNGGNDSDSEATTVIAKADVKITGVTTTSPLEVLIGQQASATIDVTVENGGPSSPVDTRLSGTATASAGASITPASTSTDQTALAKGTPQVVSQTFTLDCTTPGYKTISFSYAIALKDPSAIDPDTSNNTATASFQIDCVVPIAINVRPKGFPNSINLNTDATLAALTTAAGEYGLPLAFDATSIDPLSVRWGLRSNVFNVGTAVGATEIHNEGHLERSYELDEKTRDADLDMVLHFKPADSGLTVESTEACLKGSFLSTDGNVYRFLGCDSVIVRP